MAIEPIKGFYVHDEVTDTDGVAKYDANELEGDIAELADIRVGADGMTYPNAGDAVRTMTGANRNAMREAVHNLELGKPSLGPYQWTHGENWNNAETITHTNTAYRVCSLLPFRSSIELKMHSEDFLFKFFWKDGENITNTTWVQDYDAPANIDTWVSIRRVTENTSETANINEFLNGIDIEQCLTTIEQHDQLQADIESTQTVLLDEPYTTADADSTIAGTYVNDVGILSPLTKYNINVYHMMPGDVINVIASNGVPDVTVTILSQWENDMCIKQIATAVNTPMNVTYIIDQESDIYVTTVTQSGYNFEIKTASLSDSLIDYMKSDYTNDIIPAFKNIECYGDSLTYSQVYTSQNESRQAYHPYPKVIETKTGVPCNIKAVPGYTSLDAWNAFNSEIEASYGSLAIIYLGTNGGLTDTVTSDCADANYLNWSNNNTGAYAKLAKKLQLNGYGVILVKVHSTSGNLNDTNNAIESIGNMLQVPVIENEYLSGTVYHRWPDGSGQNGTHYNDYGYTVFAKMVMDSINNLSNYQKLLIQPT